MCVICGFVYDEAKGLPEEGFPPGTRWEDVPVDWTCPECGARKEDFEMVEIGTGKVFHLAREDIFSGFLMDRNVVVAHCNASGGVSIGKRSGFSIRKSIRNTKGSPRPPRRFISIRISSALLFIPAKGRNFWAWQIQCPAHVFQEKDCRFNRSKLIPKRGSIHAIFLFLTGNKWEMDIGKNIGE